MSKKTKEAPALPVAKKKLGSKQCPESNQNTKEKEKTMSNVTKPIFGVIYLILKVCFVIAGVTLLKMPNVNFIWSIPLFQIVGGIILMFLVYLELYAYFTKSDAKPTKKSKKTRSALDSFKLAYEDIR